MSNRFGRHHPSFMILPENKQNLGPLQGIAWFLSETTKVLSVLEKYRDFNATGLQSVLLGKLMGSKFMATKPHTINSGSITSQHKSCNTDLIRTCVPISLYLIQSVISSISTIPFPFKTVACYIVVPMI